MTCIRRLLAALVMLTSLISTAHAQLVIIVSAQSPIQTLSKQQVSNIFLGRAHAYPDGRPAVPIDLQNGTPLRDEFSERIHGISSSQLHAYWSRMIFTGKGNPPRQAVPPQVAVKLTAANSQVISYVHRGWVDNSVKVILMP